MSWVRRDGRPYLRRHFFRTPRGGRITIMGHVYEPTREPLPKRLWNERALFYLYTDHSGYTGLCALWGTEKAAKSLDESTDWPGPFCDGGTFKWYWWKKKGTSDAKT